MIMNIVKLLFALIVSGIFVVPSVVQASTVKTGLAEVNGTKLFYEMQGEGPALVLIHGGGYDRRMWDDQFELFSKQFKVIRYDVRGYGKSVMPTRPYSDVEDLYQLLRYLKIEKTHVIGLSMGGRIAIDFTLIYPHMVEKLVAVASGLSGFPYSAEDTVEFMKIVYSIQNDDGTPAGEAWLRSAYNAAAMENPAVAGKLRPIAIENSRAWLINIFFPRPPFPLAIQRLGEVRVPTLLIGGDRDVATVTKIMEMLEHNISGSRKIVVPGAGHMVNVEKPLEFNTAVMDFLMVKR
jgi:pimeloyl-ACP methyl ester carboxylesterase